jgi:hypothetical protein
MGCDCRKQVSAVHLRAWCGASQSKVDCQVDASAKRFLYVEIEQNRRLNPVTVTFHSSGAAGNVAFGSPQAAQWPETLDADPNTNKGPTSESIARASGCSGVLNETVHTKVAVQDLGGPFASRPANVGTDRLLLNIRVT